MPALTTQQSQLDYNPRKIGSAYSEIQRVSCSSEINILMPVNNALHHVPLQERKDNKTELRQGLRPPYNQR